MAFQYFILYKPFGYLSQFTSEGGNPGLGELLSLPPDIYPVGRLDNDSEGLLLLTNNKTLNHQLLNPKFAHERTYWVQVEGAPDNEGLEPLRHGVGIKVGKKPFLTRPAEVYLLGPPPDVPDRDPPVRYRKKIPDSWLEIKLLEGKNRQVRRMTAQIGYPTLRLIRVAIEGLALGEMQPGEMREMDERTVLRLLKIKQ